MLDAFEHEILDVDDTDAGCGGDVDLRLERVAINILDYIFTGNRPVAATACARSAFLTEPPRGLPGKFPSPPTYRARS